MDDLLFIMNVHFLLLRLYMRMYMNKAGQNPLYPHEESIIPLGIYTSVQTHIFNTLPSHFPAAEGCSCIIQGPIPFSMKSIWQACLVCCLSPAKGYFPCNSSVVLFSRSKIWSSYDPVS